MRNEVALLQQVLLSEIDPALALIQVKTLVAQSDEQSKLLPIQRAIECLRDEKYEDFYGNLRQCFCYFPGSLEISAETKSLIEKKAKKFGFVISEDGYKCRLNIQPIMLENIPDLSSRYNFQFRKSSKYSLGDGTLYRCFGYKKYLTLTQKLLMYMISNMSTNETMLACLPTGGGKSLSWELPALSGQLPGMVIVVVPTIALACDHEKSSQHAFDGYFGATGKVVAYHGDMEPRKKADLLNDIKSGEISILYISPEALIGQEFKQTVIQAASNGLVSMLVVDEAHLIVQWGIRFRPEFQLLATFRNELEKFSPDGIYTLLLTATLNNEDTDIIKRVFASDLFTEYRGDELRPEPSYYLHECKSKIEREELIDKICAVAPRPIIVYAAIPEMAEEYYSILKKSGYENLGLFTGNTDGEQRDKLIDQWRNNKIDIMVATSAFGMGVDKADVRTIITGYIPENISRFYQEVGRAGRDGYASLSYWLPLEQDWDIVDSLTKSTVITTDNLVDRWSALLSECEHVDSSSMWVDINTARDALKHTKTGEKNRGWNKDVVLFLVRVGLIDVLDVEKKSREEYKVLIHLKNIPLLEDNGALLSYLTDYRSAERQRIDDGKYSIKNLMRDSSWCFSDAFVGEFPYAEPQCSGCPICRANDSSAFMSESILNVFTTKKSYRKAPIDLGDDLLSVYVESRKNVMISLDDINAGKSMSELIARLIRRGVNLFVLPDDIDEDAVMARIKSIPKNRYLLLTVDEACKLPPSLIGGICAMFYTKDSSYNRKLYSFSEEYICSNSENRIIHIAQDNIQIEGKRKPLSEIVDCIITEYQFD